MKKLICKLLGHKYAQHKVGWHTTFTCGRCNKTFGGVLFIDYIERLSLMKQRIAELGVTEEKRAGYYEYHRFDR